ncbi:MAG TPA: nucleoside hydrolase [Bryobacteraceae bacterium]|jgi:inosine-uridine nucleoside N-ribohydrolase|nr:nucleoside hydrolase [Bryobacteraceae bacterium]
MRHLLLLLLAFAIASGQAPVVFDTDMGNDIDDALALAVLHALQSRGECRIIAVTITKDNPWAAPYIDLVNTFYKRPDIPIGMVKGSGVTPEDSAMIRVPAERKRPDGSFVYPHRILSGADAPDAVAVLKKALEAAPDHSVTVIQVGFSTNLAHLLDQSRELVGQKVKLLVMMAGDFAKRNPEFNIKMDIPSAQKLLRDWPTPIVTSGFEIGNSMLFPASSIVRDFPANHPVAEAYRNYQKFPYDRPTWDITAALYAVRQNDGYFSLSEPGTIQVDEKGVTTLIASSSGKHRYMVMNDVQRARALEAMILLSSQPR